MLYIYDDDGDIKFISTNIGSCRPILSCGKKIEYIYIYIYNIYK